jgi:peptide/nickel transport system permease protein
VLALAGWVRYTRVIRGSVLSVREREFVEASRATGAHTARILVRHIFPNVVSPLVVLVTFELARTLLLESTLSFLGVGVQPPDASWGTMISDGRNYLVDAWWVSLLPGVVIVIAVLAFNFLGDGLRDALDPSFQDR